MMVLAKGDEIFFLMSCGCIPVNCPYHGSNYSITRTWFGFFGLEGSNAAGLENIGSCENWYNVVTLIGQSGARPSAT
jgi:hypothetical protein